MASGDAVNILTVTTAGSTLNIIPTAGAEWIIHNIIIPDGLSTGVELYYVKASDKILIGTFKRSLIMCNFHVTYTYYLQMKNLEGTSQYLGADGIVMK